MNQPLKIELMATMKRYWTEDLVRFTVAPGYRNRDLMNQLKIPEYEVYLVFINGKEGNIESVITGGDCVALFPPIAD